MRNCKGVWRPLSEIPGYWFWMHHPYMWIWKWLRIWKIHFLIYLFIHSFILHPTHCPLPVQPLPQSFSLSPSTSPLRGWGPTRSPPILVLQVSMNQDQAAHLEEHIPHIGNSFLLQLFETHMDTKLTICYTCAMKPRLNVRFKCRLNVG